MNGYADEEESKDITETVQGDAFCKSLLFDLGSFEEIEECQNFLQDFIPPVLQGIAKKVTEKSDHLCYNIFDGICNIAENQVKMIIDFN